MVVCRFCRLPHKQPKSPHRQTKATKWRIGVSFGSGGGRGQSLAQTNQRHKRVFLRLKDDGAAMKAKRTAKSIQPIPISAETSRLQVTDPWFLANQRLLEKAGESTNHKIPATNLWWFVVFIARHKQPKSPHRQTNATKWRLGGVVSFANGGGRGQSPAQTSQTQARILPAQG